MLSLFEFEHFYKRKHTAFRQSRSLETRMQVSGKLCITSWIKSSCLNIGTGDSRNLWSRSVPHFSVDRKSFCESFRLDRPGKGRVKPFRRFYILFDVKVSRMDVDVAYNMSRVDDRSSNREIAIICLFCQRKRSTRL